MDRVEVLGLESHRFMLVLAKNRTNRFNLISYLIPLVGFLVFLLVAIFGPGVEKPNYGAPGSLLIQGEQDTIKISIGAIGDIMAHEPQIIAQKKDGDIYDFDNNYDKVRFLFKGMDLMVANLETTLSGKEKRFSGYPLFNAPDELAEAVSNAGIHVVSLANNHIYDRSESGFFRTIGVLEEFSIFPVGVRKDTTQRQYIIRDVNGIKIGITAFTYETAKVNGLKTINGLLISDKVSPLLNSFDPSDVIGESKRMKQVVNQMKADSVDLTIFMMHWGQEYNTSPNSYQVELATLLNHFGVDLIIGSHPHVVQPLGFIQHPETQHKTFVAYSLGNFISNQRFETLRNYHTEDGLLVKVELMKPAGEKVRIEKVRYFPLWVNRELRNNKQFYEVLNCIDYIGMGNNNEEWLYSEATLQRIAKSYERTRKIIEEHSAKLSNSDAFLSVLQKHIIVN